MPRELGSVVNHVQNHLKLAVHEDGVYRVSISIKKLFCEGVYIHPWFIIFVFLSRFHYSQVQLKMQRICTFSLLLLFCNCSTKRSVEISSLKMQAEAQCWGGIWRKLLIWGKSWTWLVYIFFYIVDLLVHIFSSLLATDNTQNCSI